MGPPERLLSTWAEGSKTVQPSWQRAESEEHLLGGAGETMPQPVTALSSLD